MVRAPFELYQVGSDTRAGQQPGSYWYLAPFRLWRYKDCNGKRCTVWAYAKDNAGRYLGMQYLGLLNQNSRRLL